jgi:hypothetical protein
MTGHSFLEAERARIFSGEDRDLYLHVGYFFTWFNHVEWSLTNLMAIVMGDTDLSAFHVLVKRLEGQAKVNRFIELCKVKKPITKGWTYTVRMFRPRPEILNGTWKFPEARPVG